MLNTEDDPPTDENHETAQLKKAENPQQMVLNVINATDPQYGFLITGSTLIWAYSRGMHSHTVLNGLNTPAGATGQLFSPDDSHCVLGYRGYLTITRHGAAQPNVAILRTPVINGNCLFEDTVRLITTVSLSKDEGADVELVPVGNEDV